MRRTDTSRIGRRFVLNTSRQLIGRSVSAQRSYRLYRVLTELGEMPGIQVQPSKRVLAASGN